MTQYTSCADPTESAARKERLRQAEAQGQVEESAVQMVKASIARENAEAESLAAVGVSSQERIPTISRLGPVNVELMREPNDAQTGENQDARIPVVDRLVHTTGDVTTAENPLTTEEAGGKKRKPGRPAGRRKVASSPRLAPGSCSRKRKPRTNPLQGATKQQEMELDRETFQRQARPELQGEIPRLLQITSP
ncbi:hypothetical protein YC2023_121504 [Brassica napus]